MYAGICSINCVEATDVIDLELDSFEFNGKTHIFQKCCFYPIEVENPDIWQY